MQIIDLAFIFIFWIINTKKSEKLKTATKKLDIYAIYTTWTEAVLNEKISEH